MNVPGVHEFINAPACSALQQAGVTDRSFKSAWIHLQELDGITLLRLRSMQAFNELRSSLAACDISLPPRVNDIAGLDPAIFCQAPREWLLFGERYSATHLLEQLQPALNAQHTWVLDLSAAFATYRLAGRAAPWVLSKLSCLDVQAGARSAPHAARTRLQHAAVTLRYHGQDGAVPVPAFDIIFDRGLAVYLWQLLIASIPHAEQLGQLYGTGS